MTFYNRIDYNVIERSSNVQLNFTLMKKRISLSVTSVDRLYVKRSPVASNKKDTRLSWVQFPWTSKGRKYRKDRTS